MILEALTIFSCFNNSGCSETSSAYYSTHPSFRELIETSENNIRGLVGSYVVEYATPLIGTMAKREVYFKINRNLSMKLNEKTSEIVYTKEW